jgi:hypothetical protein
MRKLAFLSFALSCAAWAQQAPVATTQSDNAIRRLPAAYRDAAGRYLHLTEKNLAHIERENDQDWTREAFATKAGVSCFHNLRKSLMAPYELVCSKHWKTS